MRHMISGGVISAIALYLALTVLGSLLPNMSGLGEVSLLFITLAVPGMLAGLGASIRERQDEKIDELKEELRALREALDKRQS